MTGSTVGSVVTGLLGTIVALAFVLALAWLVLRLLRRWQDRAGGVGHPGAGLRVVRGLAVGPRERVVIVEAEGELLLLGVAQHGVSLLTRLQPAASPEHPPR